MLELIIAVLQAYVIFSIIISLTSLVMHLMPVIYALRSAGVQCFAAKHWLMFSISYLVVCFLTAPRILLSLPSPRAYKLALYNALKDQ